MATFTASEEQKIILKALIESEDRYIRVNAVAGSGKTSTSLFLAESLGDYKFVLLTYNKFLADETVKKIKSRGLTNISAYTFHSYAGKYFGRSIFDDQELMKALESIEEEEECDGSDDGYEECYGDAKEKLVYIFDEFQDMTIPLFRLCSIFIANTGSKIMLFGDPRQCIYKYNGADERYLTKFHEISETSVTDCGLSTSYRVTTGIADFINYVCYGENVITGRPNDANSRRPYLHMAEHANDIPEWVVARIVAMISKGISPDEIFIIAASAKHKKYKNGQASPIVKIANLLSERGIKTFIDVDGHPADIRCLQNKLVITSIHKSKGRERPYVIFIGFDLTYFGMYNKDYPKEKSNYRSDGHMIMPNELYVAMTRASRMLILTMSIYDPRTPRVHSIMPPCSFITSIDALIKYTTHDPKIMAHYVSRMSFWAKNISFPDRRKIAVTDLLGSMPSVIKYDILKNCLKVTELKAEDKKKEIKTSSTSKQKDALGTYHESVSDINGITTVLLAAYHESDSVDSFLSKIISDDKETKEIIDIFREQIISGDKGNIGAILNLSVNMQTIFRGHTYRRNQIIDENWIEEDKLFEMSSRVLMNVSLDICEFPVEYEYEKDKYLVGRIDSLGLNADGSISCIYEIKTTTDGKSDSFIQAALYSYMISQNTIGGREMRETANKDIRPIKRRGELVSFSTKGVSKIGVIDSIDDNGRMIVYTENSEYIRLRKNKETLRHRHYCDDGSVIVYNCKNDTKWAVEVTCPDRFIKLCLSTLTRPSDIEFIESAKRLYQLCS